MAVTSEPICEVAFAGRSNASREPQLHRRMGVFMLRPDDQPAAGHRAKRRPEALAQPDVIPAGDQSRGPQAFDMAQTAQDVPRKQAAVPLPIVADGIDQHEVIEVGGGGPEGAHARYSSASEA